MDELPNTWSDARPLLKAVLRPVISPQQIWRTAAIDPAKAVVRKDFLPFLHQLLVIDRPLLRKFVPVERLEQWKASEFLAFSQAYANQAPAEGVVARADGLWEVRAPDAASRLLLPGWLAFFRGKVPGQPLVAIPDSGVLYIGGDGSTESRQEVVRLAAVGWREAESPLSPMLYTLSPKGDVIPWQPPPEEGSHAWVAATRCAFQQACYEGMSDFLEDLYSISSVADRWNLGDQFQVGKVEVAVGPDDAYGNPTPYTFVRWRPDTTVLPEADVVVLAQADQRAVLAVPWPAFRSYVAETAPLSGLPLPLLKTPSWDSTLAGLAPYALEPSSLAPQETDSP